MDNKLWKCARRTSLSLFWAVNVRQNRSACNAIILFVERTDIFARTLAFNLGWNLLDCHLHAHTVALIRLPAQFDIVLQTIQRGSCTICHFFFFFFLLSIQPKSTLMSAASEMERFAAFENKKPDTKNEQNDTIYDINPCV